MWQSSSPWVHSSTSAKEQSELLVQCPKPLVIWPRPSSSFTSHQPTHFALLLNSSGAPGRKHPLPGSRLQAQPAPCHQTTCPHTLPTRLQDSAPIYLLREAYRDPQCRWCPAQPAAILISSHSTHHAGLSLLPCGPPLYAVP